MSQDVARYALYYAPPADSALWAFGSRLLGYDAALGKRIQPLVPEGQDPDAWTSLTSEPRRYGFHGTLKAPFYLAQGRSEDDLREAIRDFARRQHAFSIAGLRICSIGSFIAMTPLEASDALNGLAARVVTEFDLFRAPLSPHERERRLKSPLTERQIVQLDQWGYPYVFEDFRFHMTLTGPVHSDDRTRLRDTLRQMAETSCPAEPLSIDGIALFKQNDPTTQFRIIAHVAFQ